MLKFNRILKYEIKRFKDKGFHLITAIFISYALLVLYTKIMHSIYQKIIATFDLNFIMMFGTNFVSLLSFYFFNLILYICYVSNYPWLEQFKINKTPWPWKEDKKTWDALLSETLKNLFFNQFFISPILAYCISFIKFPFDIRHNTLPSPQDIAKQLLICMIFNDLTFHFAHKLLHSNEFLYKRLHSKHHKYNNPIGISSLFAHPIEFVLSNVLPAAIGPFILGKNMHIVTLWAWTFYGIGETIEQHSGYDFPFSPYGILPFMFNASYHDFHHSRYRYNYSSIFIFWDCLFGDNNEYYNYLDYLEKKKLVSKGQSNKNILNVK